MAKGATAKKTEAQYPLDSEEANSRLIGQFTANELPKKGQEEREKEAYEAYRKSLDQNEIPHAGTIKRAFELLRNSPDERVRQMAQKLEKRRILILFQDKLGTAEVNARGHLFRPGSLRSVKTTVPAEGEIDYQARCNGVIKISTDCVGSEIATAALLAHELWHVLEGELEANGLSKPQAIELEGGDVLSSSEDFADFLAGNVLDSFGFTEQAILQPKKYVEAWGPNWSNTFDILIGKYRLYKAAKKKIDEASARTWALLRSCKYVEFDLGIPVRMQIARAGGAGSETIQPGGIDANGKRQVSLMAGVDTPYSLDATGILGELQWKGRKFRYRERRERKGMVYSANFTGELDETGRRVLNANCLVMSSRGSRLQFALADVPFAGAPLKEVGNIHRIAYETRGLKVRARVSKVSAHYVSLTNEGQTSTFAGFDFGREVTPFISIRFW